MFSLVLLCESLLAWSCCLFSGVVTSASHGLLHVLNPDHAIIAAIHELREVVDLLLSNGAKLVDCPLEGPQRHLMLVDLGLSAQNMLNLSALLLQLRLDGCKGRPGRLGLPSSDPWSTKKLGELSLLDFSALEPCPEEVLHCVHLVRHQIVFEHVLEGDGELLRRHHLVAVLIMRLEKCEDRDLLSIHKSSKWLENVLNACLELFLLLITPEAVEEIFSSNRVGALLGQLLEHAVNFKVSQLVDQGLHNLSELVLGDGV